ncbi:MAG: hypothetical protein YK1312THETA_2410003 [Marine Group I thaumarchaeote]|nr:MAG: hypothetical protein YK1312THETA_2410003 [Marine Group I thaumarchaeote]
MKGLEISVLIELSVLREILDRKGISNQKEKRKNPK